MKMIEKMIERGKEEESFDRIDRIYRIRGEKRGCISAAPDERLKALPAGGGWGHVKKNFIY